MFPKPQKVQGSFPVTSASRDPFAEGRRLARIVVRNWIVFGIIAVTAVADICEPSLGSPAFYAVAVLVSIVPLSVTVF